MCTIMESFITRSLCAGHSPSNAVPGAPLLHTNQGMVTTTCDSEQSGCHIEYVSYFHFKVKHIQGLKRSVLLHCKCVH